jgi:hypothetical protein
MDTEEEHNVTLLRIHSDLSELASLKRLAPSDSVATFWRVCHRSLGNHK